MKKNASGLVAALAAAALLAAGAARAESVVRVAMTAGDIPLTIGQPDQGAEGYRFVGYNLYDALVNWDMSQGDVPAAIRPGLATSWRIDPENNRRWLFELRQGVTFHDGCAFNADNVVWNYRRLTEQDHPYFNAAQYGIVRFRTNVIEGIEKVDDYTVAITTKKPDSLFYLQATAPLMISDCQLKALGGDYEKFATAPSGTGNYRFADMVPRERLELVPNPDYWDKDRLPQHDRLVLIPMPEATTRAAALMSGQVDFVEAPSPDTIPMLQSAGMNIVTAPYPHNWGYQLNFVDGPFKDVRVRRAANHALNRADMVAFLGGYAEEGFGILPASDNHYGEPAPYDHDPARARALLEEAGCLPCEITLAISTSGSGQMQPLPMNELVQAQLEQVGFKVTLDVMDWNKLLEVNRGGREKFKDYDGINVSRNVQDPFSAMFRFALASQFAPNGGNWGHYANPEIEALIDEIYVTFDEEKRDALIRTVHEKMVEEAAMVIVTHDINPRALSPRLEGFVQAQNWYQDLSPIRVVAD